jgi:hypothetical protein
MSQLLADRISNIPRQRFAFILIDSSALSIPRRCDRHGLAASPAERARQRDALQSPILVMILEEAKLSNPETQKRGADAAENWLWCGDPAPDDEGQHLRAGRSS